MKTKKITTKIVVAVIAFILALFVGLPVLFAPVSAFGSETESTVSGVLTDLQKDENFDTAKYPAVSNDYSLQVIQIAETTDKELLVYVYQPAHNTIDLTATSINISQAYGDSLSYKNYKLTLIDSNGVFDRYKVVGLNVLDDLLRYYDISSIYRAFNDTIDDEKDLESTTNTTSEVAYEVAKRYTACTVNGNVSYTCVETEVVTITSKIVGYVVYDEGFKLYVDKCESHFVAFSCDYAIDKLMEADIYYVTQEYIAVYGVMGGNNNPTYNDPVENYKYLTADQVANNDGDGLFAKDYTWNRIESVSNFIENESEDLNLNSSNLADLKDKQWILRFCETDYTSTMNSNGVTTVTGTRVSDVTILRLKFELDDVVYNLGVVDNKVSGSKNPFASADTNFDDAIEKIKEKLKVIEINLPQWAKKVIIIALLLLLLTVFSPFIPYFVKVIVWIVFLPFKLISAIFKGIKTTFNKKKK